MPHASEHFDIVIKPHVLRAEVVRGVVRVGCTLRELGAGGDVLAFVDGAPADDLGCRPTAGQAVVLLRVPQGSDSGKTALRIVAAIAITAFSYGYAGPALAGTLGANATAWGAAVSLVGNLALNALIPPPSQQLDGQADFQPFNRLTNSANQALLFGALPRLYGTHRVFPPLGALPYSEQVGADQYLRLLYCLGYGPLTIDAASIKIGDTALTEYEHEIEIREGAAGEPPISLFSRNVTETPLADNFELDGTQVVRTTGAGAREIVLDFVSPALIFYRAGKPSPRAVGVGMTIEISPAGAGTWTQITPTTAEVTGDGGYVPNFPAVSEDYPDTPGTLFPGYPQVQLGEVTGEKCFYLYGADTKPYAVSVRITPPAPGAYDVRVTRIGAFVSEIVVFEFGGFGSAAKGAKRVFEPSTKLASEFVWTALRTIGSDVSQTVPAGLAFIALRLKATDQLNGTVNNLSVVATSRLPVWNGSAWVEEDTSNPAFIYRDLFSGSACSRPLDLARLDDEDIKAWAAECITAGREFNGIFDSQTTVFEAAKSVAACGRGSFQIRDSLFTAVRDRPGLAPVQVFTPRNAWGFSFSKSFLRQPHALRVKFKNRDADWEDDERIVYSDGYNLDGSGGNEVATLFEDMSLFGVTDPDQAWRDGRYHLAVGVLRQESYSHEAAVEHLVCQRGDVVRVQHDAMLVGLGAGRIVALDVGSITLDEALIVESGKTYQVIVRKDDGAQVSATLTNSPGETRTLSLTGGVPAGVKVGDLASFGESGLVAMDVLVTGIEPGADLTARLTAVPYSQPAIDDAETGTIPPFDPLVTRPAEAPPQPVIVSVLFGEDAAQRNSDASRTPRIVVAYKFPSSTVRITTVQAAIKRNIEAQYVTQPDQTNNGQYVFSITSSDFDYDIRLRGVSRTGVLGPWAEISISANQAAAGELEADAITLIEQTNSPATPNGDLSTVIATVAPPDDLIQYSHSLVEYRRTGAPDWYMAGPTDAAQQVRVVLNADGSAYQFRARAVSTSGFVGNDGPLASITLSIADGEPPVGDPDDTATPDAALNVAEIRVFGELAAVNEFQGRDAIIEWDTVVPPPGAVLRDYRVRVIDTLTSAVLRVVYVLGTSYRYTFEANTADNLALSAAPQRALTFEVVARTVRGGVSAAPALKAISNPAPALPGDFSYQAFFDTMELRFSRPADGDYVGCRVYIDLVSGFFIGPATLVYDGAETQPILIPGLANATTYYVRLVLHDAFGDGPTSAEYTAITGAAPGVDTTPPTDPTALTLATAVEDAGLSTVARLTASWTGSTDGSGALFYEVEYWTDPAEKTTQTTTLTGFTVLPVQVGATYSLRVRAVDYSGNASAWTATETQLIGNDTTPPANVTDASATGGLDKVVLAWTNPADADFIETLIYRGETAGFTADAGSLIARTRADTWVDAEVQNDTAYWYKFATADVAGNLSAVSAAVGPATPNRITGVNIAQYIQPGAAVLGRKPKVVVARKSVSQAGNPPATTTLGGYVDYDVTTNLTITVAACRDYDVVVVDCDLFGAGEHSEFIRQLWEDGQKVWVCGLSTENNLFYIVETESQVGMGSLFPTLPTHPIFANVSGSTESANGRRIKKIAPGAVALGTYTDASGDISILSLAHPGGGLIIHFQSPRFSTTNFGSDQLRLNVLNYLIGPAITANTIKARSITTSMLAVGEFNNLTENGEFENGDRGWVKGTDWAIIRSTGAAFAGDYLATHVGGTDSVLANTYRPACSPGDGYYARAYIRNNFAGSGGRVRITFLDAAGALVSSVDGGLVTAATYTLSEATAIAPAGAAFVYVDVSATNAGGTTLSADRVALFRTSGATLIQDGAIITDKIAANAITADKIAANAITADKITANAITTAKISAGAVTAEKITVSSLSAINADLGTITAGTITGALIRTAASGARVQLSSANGVETYNASAVITAKLAPDGSGFLGAGGTAISWDAAGALTVPGGLITTGTIQGPLFKTTGTWSVEIGAQALVLDGDASTTYVLAYRNGSSSKLRLDQAGNMRLGGNLEIDTGGDIYSGKTSYASTTAGFWLGVDSGVPKFHLGDASNHVKWDGSLLSFTGGTVQTAASGSRIVTSVDPNPYMVFQDASAATRLLIKLDAPYGKALLQTGNGLTYSGDSHLYVLGTDDGNAVTLRGQASSSGGYGVLLVNNADATGTSYAITAIGPTGSGGSIALGTQGTGHPNWAAAPGAFAVTEDSASSGTYSVYFKTAVGTGTGVWTKLN